MLKRNKYRYFRRAKILIIVFTNFYILGLYFEFKSGASSKKLLSSNVRAFELKICTIFISSELRT